MQQSYNASLMNGKKISLCTVLLVMLSCSQGDIDLHDTRSISSESLKGHCVKVSDAPDNIADWRMKYNFGTSSVDVYAGVDKTDEEAVQAQLDANAAEKAAEADREAARIAAMSA